MSIRYRTRSLEKAESREDMNWLTLVLVKGAPELGVVQILVEGAEEVGVEEDLAAFKSLPCAGRRGG